MQRTQYGGRNALEFDGVDDWMASDPISLNTRITYFGVVKFYTSSDVPWFFEHGPNANNNDGMFFIGDVNSTWLLRRGNLHYGNSPSGFWIGTNLSFASFWYDSSGNMTSNGFVRLAPTTSGSTLSNTFVSQKLFFSSRAGTAFLSPKKQNAEHIFYTNILSSLDRRKVNEYLASKYSIPSAYRGL